MTELFEANVTLELMKLSDKRSMEKYRDKITRDIERIRNQPKEINCLDTLSVLEAIQSRVGCLIILKQDIEKKVRKDE